jgi:HSP20 family protein
MLMRRFGWPSTPWREMDRLRREMNRLFAGWPTAYRWRAAPSYPAMNVWTNEEGGVVTAELPGLAPEDIDISVQDDTLTLRGRREPDELEEGAAYHRRERGTGAFARTVQLPFRVEGDKVEATFEKGVLNISLPRAEEDKPKKIAIKSG